MSRERLGGSGSKCSAVPAGLLNQPLQRLAHPPCFAQLTDTLQMPVGPQQVPGMQEWSMKAPSEYSSRPQASPEDAVTPQ